MSELASFPTDFLGLSGSTTVVAVGLAAVAASCFAGGAVLQQRAVNAEHTPTGGRGVLSLSDLRAAIRTRGWLLGLTLATGGTTLHALALVLAPLSVVQPIGVLAVPVAVLIGVLRLRERPATGVLVGVVLAVGGVVAFVSTTASSAVATATPNRETAFAGLVVAVVVAALAGLGLGGTGWVRCVACATAGAVAFGMVSTLVRVVSQSVLVGGSSLLDPAVLGAVAGLVAAVVVGGWLIQQAFAAGAPEAVIACLTVVDPLVAVLLGAVLLGEGAATPLSAWPLLLAAAATAVVGVVVLARHHPDAVGRRAAAARGAVADAPLHRRAG